MQLNIGLIGCGAVTRKVHLPALFNDPTLSDNNRGFKISAICSRNRNNLRYFKYKLPNINSFTDYKELIDADICNAVLIATGEESHIEITQYAIDNDLFVLIEKPVSTSVENIERFIFNNRNKLNRIQVGFNKRFYPGFLKYKQLRENGDISELIGGTLFFLTRQGRKHNSLSNLIHSCDLICQIFGSPLDVKSHISIRDGSEYGETISASILTNYGNVVSLFFTSSSDWNLPYHESIEILDYKRNKFSIRNSNEAIFFQYVDEKTTNNFIFNQSNSVFWNLDPFGYKTQISAFADLVNGKVKHASPNIEDALEAHRLYEKIYESK